MRGPGYTVSDQERYVKLGDVVDSAEFVVRIAQESIDYGYLTHEEKIAQAAIATAFNWFAMSLKGQFSEESQ